MRESSGRPAIIWYSRPRRAGREIRCAPAGGPVGRPGRGWEKDLTAKGVLRKQDVPAATAVIGVKAPQAVRSAADLPELHVAWCAAIGMSLLTVEGGKARIEGLTALLADFGIITKARPATSKAPAVTPLGEWAASRLAEVFPVPLDAGLTAEELTEGAANVSAGERETLADGWLNARDPADAVREIPSAAEDMPTAVRARSR